jgi:protein-disulfide isomerase
VAGAPCGYGRRAPAAAAGRPAGARRRGGGGCGDPGVRGLGECHARAPREGTARLRGAPERPAAAPTTAATTAPPLVAPPAAEAPAAERQDVGYWREQAQKLQATLDDPQKLAQYFSAKAEREYDAESPELIDLASVPVRGPADAPVTVVVYSDFLCPYCRQLAQALAGYMPRAGGRIKLYYKNYPLESGCNPKVARTVHAGSCALALGGLCAYYQGKFDQYHDRVFATELHEPQPADVVRLAGEAGLNAAAVEGCMDDPKTKSALAAQVAEGNRLGVSSTPTVYIDGRKLPQINIFEAIVDKEARKKGAPPPSQ